VQINWGFIKRLSIGGDCGKICLTVTDNNRQNVQSVRQSVRRVPRPKRNVLILLGWSLPDDIKEIGRFAREAGWHIDARLFYTNEVPIGWCGDGLIATFGMRSDINRFIRRQASLQPTVILGGNNGGLRVPTVHVDNQSVGRLAAEHLLERNHRRFVWLGPSSASQSVAKDRRDGFIKAVHAAGMTCEVIEYTAFPQANNWERSRRWLASRLRSVPRPFALFALDDLVASEVIQVCCIQGWDVPAEISVIGAGNLDMACECSYIPITSVETRESEVAYQAAETLEQLMSGRTMPFDICMSPGPVIVRQSSETLAVAHPLLRKAIQFMKENISKPIEIDAIAKAATVSRRTLYGLFRLELDKSPVEILTSFRLERARMLLRLSEQKVSGIAEECGFGTHRSFNRLFIKSERCTPSVWREKARLDSRGKWSQASALNKS